jgi:peroxiredoxin
MNKYVQAMVIAGSMVCSASVWAQAAVNQPAPQFTAQTSTGTAVNLADYKGKYVVLEWVNPNCPFVQKHYDSGNMQALQKDAAGKGVVWLSIASNGKKASEYSSPDELNAWKKEKNVLSTAILVDSDGKVGRAFGARATPHMYVVDPQGKLIYAGAIDSKASANPADIKSATNYVGQALNEALAGKAVSKPTTSAYGCSIKYQG